MAAIKLTDGLVEALEPAEADTYLWDAALPRFGVRVTKAGARIYLVQYRVKGVPGEGSKTRRITIGQHDGDLWNVTKARAAARKLLAPVDLGRDPFAEQEAARTADRLARQAAADAEAAQHREAERREKESYRAVAERYIETAAMKARSGPETARLLRFGGARPAEPGKRRSGRPHASDTPGPMAAWGDRHIAEIRRADVADLMDTIKARSPAVARSTYAALRGLFSWCVERDLILASPCEAITAPPRPAARDRVVLDDELRLIWKGADVLGYPFGPVVKLLMLTGQRRAEVAGMTWAEVDLEAGSWRIPRERSKNGKAHEVDLSPQAVAVLKALTPSGPHLFAARGEGAVRGFSAAKRKLDGLIAAARQREAVDAGKPAPAEPLPPWRLHDLRRTAATGMAAMNFPPHVVERVLNHVSGVQSGLVGVYQRHEYRAERKAALMAWGAHVEAVVSGVAAASNVHQLRA